MAVIDAGVEPAVDGGSEPPREDAWQVEAWERALASSRQRFKRGITRPGGRCLVLREVEREVWQAWMGNRFGLETLERIGAARVLGEEVASACGGAIRMGIGVV